jgi:cysteinyl-tRNA synthetase
MPGLARMVSGGDGSAETFVTLGLEQVAADYPLNMFVDQAKAKSGAANSLALRAIDKFSLGTFMGQVRPFAKDFELLLELDKARLEARKTKNWAESDRIRDKLAAMGVTIKDNKDGTTSWEVN